MFLERMQKGLAHIPGIPLNTYTNWVRGIRDPLFGVVCAYLHSIGCSG